MPAVKTGHVRAERPGHQRARRVLALAAGLALLALAVAVAASQEVVRKGELFSYSDGRIYEVRVLDLVNVYVEPEVTSLDPLLDLFNASLLLLVTGMALFGYALLRSLARPGDGRVRTFLLLTALGTGYLAADELLGIHESIGHNMRFLADIPGNEQPDGAIVVVYLVLVCVYLYAFRDLLLSSRGAKRLFGLGAAVAVLAVAIDVVDGPLEEVVESLAALSFLAGFFVLNAELIAEVVGAREPSTD
jgi:hypothetical protein